MTLLRRTLLAVALLLFALVAGAAWVVATDTGTRWLLGRATTYLPDQLKVGDLRGSLLRGVELASLEWRDATLHVEAQSARVEIRLLPLLGRRVLVETLDIASIDVNITEGGKSDAETSLPDIDLPVDISVLSSSVRNVSVVTGGFERTVDEIMLAGELSDSDLTVSRLIVRSSWLDLDLRGRMTLAGLYPGRIDADWQWKEAELGPFAGRLSATGDLDEYSLEHSLATPLEVASSGIVSFESGAIDADLLHEWKSIEWPLGERRLYSSHGTLRTAGNTEAVAIELAAQGRVDDSPEVRIGVSGDVHLLPARAFDVEYHIADLDPALLLDGVSGSIALQGRANGILRDDGPQIDVRIARIDGEANGNPVQGGGAMRIVDSEVLLADTRVQVGSNSVSADGTLGSSLSLRAMIDAPDIAEAVRDSAGSVRGSIAIEGPREDPDITLDLAGAGLAWRNYAIDEAQILVSGRLATHSIRASLRGLDSKLEIEATGGFDQPNWSGQISSLAVANDVLDRWSLLDPSQLVASSDRASLTETCLYGAQHAGKVCLGGAFVAGGAASFDVSTSGVPLAALPAALPENFALSGYLDGNISGQWENDRLTARSTIGLRDAAIDVVYDDEQLTVDVSEAVGEVTVTDNKVDSTLRMDLDAGATTGTLRLSVEDFTNRRSMISGRAEVSVPDASSVAIMVPGILNPKGQVDGELSVTGTLDAPEFLGEIVLADGSFDVRQTGIGVSGVELRLAQLAPGQLRLTGSARSGDGQLAVNGRTSIGSDTGIRSEIELSGENFELARLPDWNVSASPSIMVVFDDRSALVSGELAIPKADIAVREIPESAESPSSDAVVHRRESSEPSPARRIDIDVNTVLGEDVRFAGFGLATGLEGAVQIKGGNQALFTGQGRLSLRGGRYKAYGQELEIERGELIFNGPLDSPRLNVRAVRQIQTVTAGIELSGVPTQLRSSVFSEPAMSDAEVLSYLLTGRPLASVSTSGDSDALNNAAFALGLSGAGAITSQVRAELGLDTLSIEGASDDSRLIAGKRFGDRLLVEYGYGLIDKLGTLLLRYQLNQRLVLESRTGTVSTLDVVYSVKKK